MSSARMLTMKCPRGVMVTVSIAQFGLTKNRTEEDAERLANIDIHQASFFCRSGKAGLSSDVMFISQRGR